MVLDLLFGIAAAWTLAEGAHVVRGGMSTREENEFDKKNGARGIDPREVVKIAQRNGVYPNKHGVLPAEPNSRIMKYVIQYANKPSDIEEFKRQWYLTVQKQLDNKHHKIKTESKDSLDYEKNKQYYLNEVIPYLSDETLFLDINHWHTMPEDLHYGRMESIIEDTIWGNFVVNYSLRDNPRISMSHIEYYELRIPKNKPMGKYEFKELYKQCCAYLGYDVML